MNKKIIDFREIGFKKNELTIKMIRDINEKEINSQSKFIEYLKDNNLYQIKNKEEINFQQILE